MLHLIRLLERRHPAARRALPLVMVVPGIALAIGIALALLR